MMTERSDQPEARDVLLRKIRVHSEFQVREKLHGPTIDRYVEILAQLPPVDLFELDGELVLVDGFHRVEAHRRAAKADAKARAARASAAPADKAAFRRNEELNHRVPALIHRGSPSEALKHAAEANVAHGRGLSGWDLYRAIAMRSRASRVSLRTLAKTMGTNHETVRTALIADRLLQVAPLESVKRLTTREILEVEGVDEVSWPDTIEETLARRPESSRRVSPNAALAAAIGAMHRLEQYSPEQVVDGMVSKRAALVVDQIDGFISTLSGIRQEAQQLAPAKPEPAA